MPISFSLDDERQNLLSILGFNSPVNETECRERVSVPEEHRSCSNNNRPNLPNHSKRSTRNPNSPVSRKRKRSVTMFHRNRGAPQQWKAHLYGLIRASSDVARVIFGSTQILLSVSNESREQSRSIAILSRCRPILEGYQRARSAMESQTD
jgi:hypothetical protein